MDILRDETLQLVLVYLGLFLTIYYEYKKKHKRIKYKKIQTVDRCILCFWNAGNDIISSDDIGYLALQHYPVDSVEVKQDMRLNYDIPLKIEKSKVVKWLIESTDNNITLQHTELNFPFLNKRDGYILYIYNLNSESLVESLRLVGRLKGETKFWSVMKQPDEAYNAWSYLSKIFIDVVISFIYIIYVYSIISVNGIGFIEWVIMIIFPYILFKSFSFQLNELMPRKIKKLLKKLV